MRHVVRNPAGDAPVRGALDQIAGRLIPVATAVDRDQEAVDVRTADDAHRAAGRRSAVGRQVVGPERPLRAEIQPAQIHAFGDARDLATAADLQIHLHSAGQLPGRDSREKQHESRPAHHPHHMLAHFALHTIAR